MSIWIGVVTVGGKDNVYCLFFVQTLKRILELQTNYKDLTDMLVHNMGKYTHSFSSRKCYILVRVMIDVKVILQVLGESWKN